MSYTQGELLVRGGAISAEAHRRALAMRATRGGSLGECLVQLGVIDEAQLAAFYHKRLVLPLLPPVRFASIPAAILKLVPAEVAADFRLIPLSIDGDGALLVGMADPSDNHAVEELAFFVDRFILRGVATESTIRHAVERHYGVRLTVRTPLGPRGDDSPLFPANVEERSYDPFGPRSQPAPSAPIEEPVVLLTKKKHVDETPLPPHHPPPPELEDTAPLVLTQPKRGRERTSTLPGLSPVTISPPQAPPPQIRPPIPELRAATDRETVGRVLLEYSAQIFGRAALFVVRKGVLAGFDARGGDLDRAAVEVLQIPLSGQSVFRDVTRSRLPFRGPLPDTAQNRILARALGTAPAAEVLVCPIVVRERVVAVLFADRIERVLPETELQATLWEAGLAYARIIIQTRANPEDPPR